MTTPSAAAIQQGLLGRHRRTTRLSAAPLTLALLAATVLDETKLATLDHRHFLTVKPAHCETLQLLPA